MKPLTNKQLAVYEYILHYREKFGFPPSRSEIQNRMQFKSCNSVYQILLGLVRKEKIELNNGIARGIKVL